MTMFESTILVEPWAGNFNTTYIISQTPLYVSSSREVDTTAGNSLFYFLVSLCKCVLYGLCWARFLGTCFAASLNEDK